MDFQGIDWGAMQTFGLRAAAVILCLVVHEVCHGLAAFALGAPTAKEQNRLSLNPLRHLDVFGTLMLFFVGFGWAKPVPVDMRYFKNPKLGMALTALAGPMSNFLMAYLSTLLYSWAVVQVYVGELSGQWTQGLLLFLQLLIQFNIGLGIFNLIPIPPLDGSKVLEGILPDRIYYKILQYERYGMLILVGILWLGWLDEPLYFARTWMTELLFTGTAWIIPLIT